MAVTQASSDLETNAAHHFELEPKVCTTIRSLSCLIFGSPHSPKRDVTSGAGLGL